MQLQGHWLPKILINWTHSIGTQIKNTLGPRPHGAKTGENDPVLFYVVQEYLPKDVIIVKPHRAIETLL
jgi:hypothetical protein